jgi:carboxyl-terminal processing protease
VADTQLVRLEPKQKRGISKAIYFLSIAVAIAVGFVGGTRSNELLAVVAPIFGIKVETGTLDLASLQKTYQTLKANYDGDVTADQLITGANHGLVASLGDPYTVYMSADEAAEFEKELSGDVGAGIGAEIGVRSDRPTILRVLADHPAEEAGLKAGDVIAAINDQPALEWTADEAASAIRGEAGTTVKLAVVRNDKPLDFTVTRAKINNPSVSSEIKDGIGILTVTRFDNETASLARQAARDFKDKNVRGVVLDMRGNGGGYLTAAQDVAGIWLKDKVVVTERTGGQVTDELKSGGDPILEGVPTMVLVNGASASASEIVAGALQDHRAAKLIGEKTFGKGTVQKLLDLGGGTMLKVTVARWYTPNGKNITEEGIKPDTEVVLTAEDANTGRDPQQEAALGLLKK